MFRLLVVPAIVVTLASLGASAASNLSGYRGVTLGDSVATVVERLQLATSDVRVLYEQPTLVQEVTWRPHRFISGSTVTPDPLAEMVLTFHEERLARIVATYDRERTQGLTDADLLESLTSIYGVAMLPTTNTHPLLTSAVSRQIVGRWADADTLLLLWREDYPRRVGLTITATAAEASLQDAIVEGARLAAEGAPAREREKQAAAAAAITERDARIRLENKAKFKP